MGTGASIVASLMAAIAALSSAIVVLWRQNNALRDEAHAEQVETARLIFALLQRLAMFRNEQPPPTSSTSEKPDLAEAKRLAAQEVNGEIESLLRSYLDSDHPTADRRSRA